MKAPELQPDQAYLVRQRGHLYAIALGIGAVVLAIVERYVIFEFILPPLAVVAISLLPETLGVGAFVIAGRAADRESRPEETALRVAGLALAVVAGCRAVGFAVLLTGRWTGGSGLLVAISVGALVVLLTTIPAIASWLVPRGGCLSREGELIAARAGALVGFSFVIALGVRSVSGAMLTSTGGALGEVWYLSDLAAQVLLWVAGAMLGLALLGQMIGNMPRRPGRERRCPECGYSLTGLPQALCPECGSPTTRRPGDAEWEP